MKKRLLEIIRAARAAGVDPVEWVLDYLREKDSHITRREAARLVERLDPHSRR